MRNSQQCHWPQEFHNLQISIHSKLRTFLKRHSKGEYLLIVSSLPHIFWELISKLDKQSNLNAAYPMICNGSFLFKYYHCFYICLSMVLFTNLNTKPQCSLLLRESHLQIGCCHLSVFLGFHCMYFFDYRSVLIIFEATHL